MILFSDNSITARHGFPVAGLPVSCTPTTFPAFCRLCAVLRPAGGIFASASSRSRHTPKSKPAVKAICRPVTAFYTLMAIPIFTHRKTSHRSRQRPAHGIKQPRPALSGASRGIVIAFALLPCSVPILHPTLDRSGQCSAHHAQRSKSDLLCHQPPHPPPICMRHSQYQGIGPFAPCLPPLFVPGNGWHRATLFVSVPPRAGAALALYGLHCYRCPPFGRAHSHHAGQIHQRAYSLALKIFYHNRLTSRKSLT